MYRTVLPTLPPAPSSGEITVIHATYMYRPRLLATRRGFHGKSERVRVWLGGPCYCRAGPHQRTTSMPTGRREAQRGGDQTGRVKRSQRQTGSEGGQRNEETERQRYRQREAPDYSSSSALPSPWNAIVNGHANSASRWTGGVALERRDMPLSGRRGALLPPAEDGHAVRRDALLVFSGDAFCMFMYREEWRID